MLTAFPLDSDRFGHVLPCDVAVTGECNGWHLYNWGFDAPPGQTQMPAPTENRDPQCADRTASLQVDPTCDSQTLPQTTAGTSVQVNVQDVSQTASARMVFDAYRTIQPGSLQVSLNGSAWQMVPRLSTPNDGRWVNQARQADLPVGSSHSGANTVRFRATSPASDDARVSNVEIEQTRTFAYTRPLLPPEPAPIGIWAASIPGAHH